MMIVCHLILSFVLLAVRIESHSLRKAKSYEDLNYHGEVGCGTEDPTDMQKERAQRNEISVFGAAVSSMERSRFSEVLQSVNLDFDRRKRRLQSEGNAAYRLRDIPIVFHILPNQDNGGSGSPSATELQIDFMMEQTNDLYYVYDRETATGVQWITFVRDEIIVHDDYKFRRDCKFLMTGQRDFYRLIRQVDEWQFKMHAVVCESSEFSGMASFPSRFSVRDPRHNMALVDYRAMACYDKEGNFLCDLSEDGQQVSHSRWWRSSSTVLAHEFGHLFGLSHTFQGENCRRDGDDVPDTPTERSSRVRGCPGLLPYDRDRDLFDVNKSRNANIGDTSTCGGESNLCGDTCAACCDNCNLYGSNELESITEDENPTPVCCDDPAPIDSCPEQSGIDALNNIMGYAPDFCTHELTPGQLTRMIAQVKREKTYIYCNYADVDDPSECKRVPCASTSTSPTCQNQ